MPYDDLKEFLNALEVAGELRRINCEVDTYLEMTEIADRTCKRQGPALLFENPKGYDMPVLLNAFGSMRRMLMALDVEDFSEVSERLLGLLQFELPKGLIEKISTLPKLGELAAYFPRKVKNGPCKEIIEKTHPSLDELPVLHCWPGDGGRFITLPLVFTRDPESGKRNVGMYRMHVYDEKTTGMHWHIHKDAAEHYRRWQRLRKQMEVAVCLGGDPATIYAGTAPLPFGLDELIFAGFIRKKSVEVVPCETISLEVPANSEIVIEGYVNPDETRLEGPFGDHTGYYSPPDYYPVFHVTCITRRLDAVYPATVVGRPPMEDCFLAKTSERIFLPLIKLQIPEIVDINLPVEGVFQNLAIISIRKSYPGQARKVMNAIWGLGQMAFTKIIVVVDEDVDVQNLQEVIWRVGNNIDPRRDIAFVEGPVDALDHASGEPNFGSKMGIDATRKLPEEGHKREWPEDIRMSEEIVEKVTKRWEEYGLG